MKFVFVFLCLGSVWNRIWNLIRNATAVASTLLPLPVLSHKNNFSSERISSQNSFKNPRPKAERVKERALRLALYCSQGQHCLFCLSLSLPFSPVYFSFILLGLEYKTFYGSNRSLSPSRRHYQLQE